MFYLATTRFTNATWDENCAYRAKLPADTSVKCIYLSQFAMDARIPKKANILVVEMNNETNRILGLGWIQNLPISQKYRVYSKEEYNRYAFVGKYRLDRTEITDRELLAKLEQYCFYGKGHQKRLRGITRIPPLKFVQWCVEHWNYNGDDNDDNHDKEGKKGKGKVSEVPLLPDVKQLIHKEFTKRFPALSK
jgi:hypothetical protein